MKKDNLSPTGWQCECGLNIQDTEWEFCPSCARKLPAIVKDGYCSCCMEDVDNYWEYCAICGRKLIKEE